MKCNLCGEDTGAGSLDDLIVASGLIGRAHVRCLERQKRLVAAHNKATVIATVACMRCNEATGSARNPIVDFEGRGWTHVRCEIDSVRKAWEDQSLRVSRDHSKELRAEQVLAADMRAVARGVGEELNAAKALIAEYSGHAQQQADDLARANRRPTNIEHTVALAKIDELRRLIDSLLQAIAHENRCNLRETMPARAVADVNAPGDTLGVQATHEPPVQRDSDSESKGEA